GSGLGNGNGTGTGNGLGNGAGTGAGAGPGLGNGSDLGTSNGTGLGNGSGLGLGNGIGNSNGSEKGNGNGNANGHEDDDGDGSEHGPDNDHGLGLGNGNGRGKGDVHRLAGGVPGAVSAARAAQRARDEAFRLEADKAKSDAAVPPGEAARARHALRFDLTPSGDRGRDAGNVASEGSLIMHTPESRRRAAEAYEEQANGFGRYSLVAGFVRALPVSPEPRPGARTAFGVAPQNASPPRAGAGGPAPATASQPAWTTDATRPAGTWNRTASAPGSGLPGWRPGNDGK
ncbi:MAG: hypothetical protein AB7V01_12505, partial [Vicinamibacterales bacterium]